MSSIFACDLGLNRKTLSGNFFCCFVFRFREIFFNQHWRQMRASLILLFGKTKAFFGKDTARKKTAFLHTLFVENERETSKLKWGVMFFYKVEGHMPKLSSFGWGKKKVTYELVARSPSIEPVFQITFKGMVPMRSFEGLIDVGLNPHIIPSLPFILSGQVVSSLGFWPLLSGTPLNHNNHIHVSGLSLYLVLSLIQFSFSSKIATWSSISALPKYTWHLRLIKINI